jgi:hypothetical protein
MADAGKGDLTAALPVLAAQGEHLDPQMAIGVLRYIFVRFVYQLCGGLKVAFAAPYTCLENPQCRVTFDIVGELCYIARRGTNRDRDA